MNTLALLRSRSFVLLVATNFFAAAGVGICLVITPWYLVNSEGGNTIFGYAAFGTNLSLVFLSPLCGIYIDRLPRKVSMLALRLAFMTVLGLSLYLSISDTHTTLMLVLYYASGNIFLMINNSARLAFVQEVFAASSYNFVNAVMEVEKQAATVLTGAAVAMVLKSWTIPEVILANLIAMILSTVALCLIRHTSTIGSRAAEHGHLKVIAADFMDGWRYLSARPAIAIFLVVSFMPYITVLIGNYLVPVLIAKVLMADIVQLATFDIVFGVGAIICGLSLPRLVARNNYVGVIVANMALFAAVILLQAIRPSIVTVVWMGLVIGFTNSAVRIARNSWMMHIIRKDMIGRVNTTLSSVVLGVKAFLTGAVAWLVAVGGAISALWVLFTLLLVCVLIAATCARAMRRIANDAPAPASS